MKYRIPIRERSGVSPAKAPTRILVVDDDEDLRSLHAQILREANYDVETAGDGEQALHKIAFQPFDMVVTDWQMPYLDGASLVLWMRAMRNRTPVIMVTGSDTTQALPAPMRRELEAILAKPVSVGHLLAVVQRTLGDEPTEEATAQFAQPVTA